MKKTFPLSVPGKDRQRVVEAIQHDVRKYVKRERRKELPEGAGVWEFNCRVGPSQEAAEARPLPEVSRAIDGVAKAGAAEIYVEILATPGLRAKPTAPFRPARA